ncbi:MAG: protein kinase, partial [Planctomycetaceae bacterium]|nr:protein kinase [Planctomycetaceae bacterium]
GAIPAEESIDLICQLCAGLGTAHAATIIHRDITPAHVLVTTSNVPKLTDFGLAKDEAADTGMTMQGAVLGTLDFMPPEQRKDASLTDARSDLWSLAATFYQMVTGESPRVIDLDEVPSELRKCIGKALKSRKEDRYQTAVDLRAAIQEALSNQTIEPAPTVELGAGECSQCHARNEASRKFCNSCGASLRNPCLQCEVEIPVWDKFCPECGSDQHVILKEKINGFNQQLVRAEELLSSYAFDQSRTIVDPVAALADTRFGEVVGRAGKLQITIEARRKQEFQTAENKFDEAQRNMAAFDYESAIRVLSGVPEPLHQQVAAGNDTLDVYLAGLVAKKAELESLMQVIKQRVKDRNLNGLLEQVNRAAKLDGSSQPIQKLQSQLRKRDAARKEKYDEIHQRASEQLAEGNAKAALRTVSQSKEDGFPDKLRELKKKLTNLVELENELVGLVKEAKADGVIDAIEVYKLLPKAEHYLKLNPHKKSINKLVEDLYFKVVQAWQSKYHDFASSGGKSSVLAVELLRDLRDIIDEFPISQRKASFNELTKKQVEDLHLCVEQSFQNKFAALMKKNSGSEELCINLLRDLRDFIDEFPACKRIASFNEMNQKLTEYVKALPLNKLKGLPFELAQIIFEEEIASKSGMGKINLISDLRKYCS